MPRDRLRIIRTVRQRGVEHARQALAACLQAEADAAERIQAIDVAGIKDRAAYHGIEDGFRFQEMFSRRVQARAADRRSAEAALAAAQDRSAETRATVVAAQTALEAVETLINERAAAAAHEADQRLQHALDDMTRSRRPVAERFAGSKGLEAN